MTIQLRPIKPRRISDQVFDQLRELIFRGELKPGQRIMAERKLCEVMGVSRTSVRDAINRLVTLGLLEHKQGQGTYVRSLVNSSNNPVALAMESENASLEDLLEVRMGIECSAAAYAANRAEPEDIRLIEISLEELKTEFESGRLGTQADVAFHMAIAYATKNPVQVNIMKNLYDFLFHGIRENLAQLYEKPGNIEKICEQHLSIFNTIADHDPDEAYRAMRTHIQFVLDFLAEGYQR